MKRLFDIILSAFALAMLSPLLLLTALAIAIESGSTVLFRQIRLGFAGREFGMSISVREYTPARIQDVRVEPTVRT